MNDMTQTTGKAEKLLTMDDCKRCFASMARGTIIDVLHPMTGRTLCYGKTLAECREEYPDAEEMSVDAYCAQKAAQQRASVAWELTTAEKFDEMLCVLPPAAMHSGGFLVGEPWDHDAGNGQPRFQAYRKRGDAYETSKRPMTRAEFKTEMAGSK